MPPVCNTWFHAPGLEGHLLPTAVLRFSASTTQLTPLGPSLTSGAQPHPTGPCLHSTKWYALPTPTPPRQVLVSMAHPHHAHSSMLQVQEPASSATEEHALQDFTEYRASPVRQTPQRFVLPRRDRLSVPTTDEWIHAMTIADPRFGTCTYTKVVPAQCRPHPDSRISQALGYLI